MHLDLLVRMLAVVVAGDVTDQNDHGDGVQAGVGNTGDNVGDTGAQVAHNHGSLVGHTGVTISGGGSHGLVAAADVLDLLAAGQGVQHTDNGMAAQTEQLGNAAALQIVDQQVGNQFLAHINHTS